MRSGNEYIAITDHSSGAAASRTLARGDISRQRDEIDALRDRFPGMTILHGIEVDILPDGRLDFEDAILERFDIVLASLHEHAGQDARQLTRRSVAAIRHPLVNVSVPPGKPARRLLGRVRARFRRALRRRRRDRDGARNRRRAEPHGFGRRPRARGSGRGGDAHHRQRLPSRAGARAPDAFWRRHRPPWVGRAPPRPQYAGTGRCAGVHRRQTAWRPLLPRRVGRVVTWLMRLAEWK